MAGHLGERVQQVSRIECNLNRQTGRHALHLHFCPGKQSEHLSLQGALDDSTGGRAQPHDEASHTQSVRGEGHRLAELRRHLAGAGRRVQTKKAAAENGRRHRSVRVLLANQRQGVLGRMNSADAKIENRIRLWRHRRTHSANHLQQEVGSTGLRATDFEP